jgi:hypothetical protein
VETEAEDASDQTASTEQAELQAQLAAKDDEIAVKDAKIAELEAKLAAIEKEQGDPLDRMKVTDLKAYAKKKGFTHLNLGKYISSDTVRDYEHRLKLLEEHGTQEGMDAVKTELNSVHTNVARVSLHFYDCIYCHTLTRDCCAAGQDCLRGVQDLVVSER